MTPATVSGVEGQPIALNLASEITATGLSGDSNIINAVTLTFTVPSGDTYSFASTSAGLNQTFAAGAGQTLILTAGQIASGVLSDLTIKTANDSNVSLGISATEKDAEGNVSAAATGTQTVTVIAPLSITSVSTSPSADGEIVQHNQVHGSATIDVVFNEAVTTTGAILTFNNGATTSAVTQNGNPDELIFTYTPGNNGNETTPDLSITSFTVNGAKVTLTQAMGLEIGVNEASSALAINGSITTTVNTAVNGFLSPSDPGGASGDATFAIATAPPSADGTVTITNTHTGAFTFTPKSGFVGSGSFTFTVTDDGVISAPATESFTVNSAPAGIAGDPINLGLIAPDSGQNSIVTVTIKDALAGWVLNGGTPNTDGSWTTTTSDLSALTLTTPPTYSGAAVIHVTETWTNADGSTGSTVVGENIEAYASGSPIFAIAGDDTLTGAGGNDLFVFAQPIGNDIVHNFNAASDKIDLIGFNGITSFGDIHLADDANSNAVITLASGETITLQGTDAGSLTAGNFVFDQTPVTENAGSMVVSDGALLPLNGTIDNTGTILLYSSGDQTEVQLTGDGITLDGGGYVILSDNSDNVIVGTSSASTLTNVDNTISGVGQIGSGDGTLTLINEAHATIDANITGATLTLETGNTITNAGLLEATNGGILKIEDPVEGGNSVIQGGTVQFDAASNVDVAFDHGANGTTYGAMVLGDASEFTGHISGFSGSAPDPAHSDTVNLSEFDYASTTFSETSSNGSLVLTATEGGKSATVTFDNLDGALSFAADGHGGSLITDEPAASAATASGVLSSAGDTSAAGSNVSVTPQGAGYVGSFSVTPAVTGNGSASVQWGFDLGDDQINLSSGQTVTQSYDVAVNNGPNNTSNQTVSVSLGGSGNDNFVFAPGIGADTIVNFDPQRDTIDLSHFQNVQSVQELASMITTDQHGNAVIDLGNHDSISIPGMTAVQLQQMLQSVVHLH